jgi:hypothetical protein
MPPADGSDLDQRQEDNDMRTLQASLSATLLTILCAGTASAAMTVYYHAGGWDAFSGIGDNGKAVCGVGITNPADNRSFSMRFQVGADSMTFQAKKPNWKIPEGTQLSVVMQIGLDTPWNLQGIGNGQVVEFALDRATVETFDAQFRRANSMTLTYPSGNEPPWTIGLNGSTAISNAFGRCVTEMTQRDAAQAQSSTPPADAGPTQPFSQAAAQPAVAPAPTQPVAPSPSQPYSTSGTPAVPR